MAESTPLSLPQVKDIVSPNDQYISRLTAPKTAFYTLFEPAAELGVNIVWQMYRDGLLPKSYMAIFLNDSVPEAIANAVEAIGERAKGPEDFEPEVISCGLYTPTHTGFQVIDNGVGFNQELLEIVGREQLESSKKDRPIHTFRLGGMGTFLYSVHQTCEARGWEMSVSNRTDSQGAVFSLLIPRK